MTVLNVIRAVALALATLSMLVLVRQVGSITFAAPLNGIVDGYDAIVGSITIGIEQLLDSALRLIDLQWQQQGRQLLIYVICVLLIWPWAILRTWPVWEQFFWFVGVAILAVLFTPIV